MACHETHEHCIGRLINQLGSDNNVRLRLKMRHCENADAIRLRGEQYQRFEDTLPKMARNSSPADENRANSS